MKKFKAMATTIFIKEGKEINYRKNNIISESEFNALPDNKKLHFLEFCKLPGQMTDLDLKKVVIDLMERVEKLEAKAIPFCYGPLLE